MSIALTEPAEALKRDSGTEADHIVCLCRPLVAACGAYDDSPIDDGDWDENNCPACVEYWESGGACPNCGCVMDECCDRCCDGKCGDE